MTAAVGLLKSSNDKSTLHLTSYDSWFSDFSIFFTLGIHVSFHLLLLIWVAAKAGKLINCEWFKPRKVQKCIRKPTFVLKKKTCFSFM